MYKLFELGAYCEYLHGEKCIDTLRHARRLAVSMQCTVHWKFEGGEMPYKGPEGV